MSNGVKNPAFDTPEQTQQGHSAFVPVLLTLISFLMILGWTLTVTVRQSVNLQDVKFQVWQATTQSVQAEEKLKAMLSDLVDLSKEDPAAAAIVKQYKIKQNAPAAVAPTTTLKPAAKPTVKPEAKPAVKEPVKEVEKPVAKAAEKTE